MSSSTARARRSLNKAAASLVVIAGLDPATRPSDSILCLGRWIDPGDKAGPHDEVAIAVDGAIAGLLRRPGNDYITRAGAHR